MHSTSNKHSKNNYKVMPEWDGTRYIGITIVWDYRRRQVHLYLPGYTDKALKQFNRTKKLSILKRTYHI